MVSETDHEVIITRINRRSDEDASVMHSITLNELCEQYYTYVYRRIYCLTHDHYRAEELTQETFLKVTRFFHTLKNQHNLKAWLWLVATRVVYDSVKKAKQHPCLSYDDPDADLNPETSRDDPERLYTECELMHQALSRLNAPNREALVSYYVEGKPAEDMYAIYQARKNLNDVYKRLLKRTEREMEAAA